MSRSFFTALREKMRREPEASFDRAFWAKFKAEFDGELGAASRRPSQRWLSAMSLRFALPVAMAVCVTFAVIGYRWTTHPTTSAPGAALAEVAPMLQDLDLFLPPRADLPQIDMTALDDDEWQLLLEDG